MIRELFQVGVFGIAMAAAMTYFQKNGIAHLQKLAFWLWAKRHRRSKAEEELRHDLWLRAMGKRWRSSQTISFLILMLAFAMPAFASQADWYFTQSGSGTHAGTSCASNPASAADFNDGSKWGAGSTQIGPGTTVHLCGTITTTITFLGSGAAGNPIIVKFENNAKFSAPTWAGNRVISASNRSYIEVDGGTNGLIEATNNGSSPTYTNQDSGRGVSFPGCSYCRVHNLTVSNIFVKNTSDSQGDGQGIELSNSSNSRIDHNTVHDANICVNWDLYSNTNIEIDHNVLYHCNWATKIGTYGDITASNILWHDNEVYDWSNWDDFVNNDFHHNGIHLYLEGGTGASVVTGIQIYNNYFHGDPGSRMTANIYFEANNGTYSSPLIFNNVHSMSNHTPANAVLYMKNHVTSPLVYNNTYADASNLSGLCIEVQGATAGSFYNNIYQNCGTVYYRASGDISASDYNVFYGNSYLGPYPDGNSSLSSWQKEQELDTHSITSNPGFTGNAAPTTSDPVYHAGVDLSGLGITALNTSLNGVARGSGSPWTIGANDATGGPAATVTTIVRAGTMMICLIIALWLPIFFSEKRESGLEIIETKENVQCQRYF